MANESAVNRQFLPRNPGGPGRPKTELMSRFQIAMETTITESNWRRLVRVTYERALNGDAKSPDWLARYLIGREKPKGTRSVSVTDNLPLESGLNPG